MPPDCPLLSFSDPRLSLGDNSAHGVRFSSKWSNFKTLRERRPRFRWLRVPLIVRFREVRGKGTNRDNWGQPVYLKRVNWTVQGRRKQREVAEVRTGSHQRSHSHLRTPAAIRVLTSSSLGNQPLPYQGLPYCVVYNHQAA
jgi:hypothetical protein